MYGDPLREGTPRYTSLYGLKDVLTVPTGKDVLKTPPVCSMVTIVNFPNLLRVILHLLIVNS